MKSGPALVKWPILGVAVVWIAAFGWLELVRPDPHAEMRAQRNEERLQQKIKDCRGNFSQRYDCKSALVREKDAQEFYEWAEKLSLTFAPPLALFAFYIGFVVIRERKAEAVRRVRRVKRIEKEKEDSRILAIEEGRKRAEEARKRAEEKKREKEARKREKEGELKEEASEKAPEQAPAEAKAPQQASVKSEPQQRRVLLIDDVGAEVEAVTKKLAVSGIGVAHFPDMEHALAVFAKSGGDLVITNVLAGGMDGLEGIKKLRDLRSDIKIIAISGGVADMSPEDVLAAAKKMGADGVMAKPLDVDKLGEMVLGLLG